MSFMDFKDHLVLCETSRSIKEVLEKLEVVWIQLGRLSFKSNLDDKELARTIFHAKVKGSGLFYDSKPAGYFGRTYFVGLMHELNKMKRVLLSISSDRLCAVLYSQTFITFMQRYRSFTLATSELVLPDDKSDPPYEYVDSPESHPFNWDIVRHFGTMVCAEWEYCKVNGFDRGRGTSDLQAMLLGLHKFLRMAYRAMENVRFNLLSSHFSMRFQQWCKWAYLGDKLYEQVWSCVTEYYSLCSLGSHESRLLFDVAESLWYTRTRARNRHGALIWKESEKVYVTRFACVVAQKLHNVWQRKRDRRGTCEGPCAFSDSAYKRETVTMLNFYYKIQCIVGDSSFDIRTSLYTDIMAEVMEELRLTSISYPLTCQEVLEALLWQHQRIQKQTALNMDLEYSRVCGQVLPVLERHVDALKIDPRLLANLSSHVLPISQPDSPHGSS